MVHFLGGAFAGAAPQLFYNSFIELLADSGYTVIATPYRVTFQHDVCARKVSWPALCVCACVCSNDSSRLPSPRLCDR